MPRAFDLLTFQIDHIIARKHHGTDEPDNLALACFACNNHKGPNIAGIDRVSGDVVQLFHPRRDRWEEHLEWNGASLHRDDVMVHPMLAKVERQKKRNRTTRA